MQLSILLGVLGTCEIYWFKILDSSRLRYKFLSELDDPKGESSATDLESSLDGSLFAACWMDLAKNGQEATEQFGHFVIFSTDPFDPRGEFKPRVPMI